MPYDIRQFIEDLKEAGELIEIDEEVDWNYEISAYEILSGYFDGPAFLFNNIKGVKSGRVLVGHFAGSYQKPHKRHAICLGLDPNMDRASWVRGASRAIGTMLKPVEVATRIGLSLSCVRGMLRRGELPALVLRRGCGRSRTRSIYRVPETALTQWLEDRPWVGPERFHPKKRKRGTP